MAQLSDAGLARSLLNAALRFGLTSPDLSEAEMLLLMDRAKVTLPDASIVYTTASMNAAAAQGWTWKADQAAGEYDDLGDIKRPIGLAERWKASARAYAAGQADVLAGIPPATTLRSSSIGMVGELAAEYPL
jgi:hypothetical protein